MGSFLELEHVTVVRGGRTVLHDVSLQMERGEQVALLGRLAYAAQFRESEKQGQAFFKLMRKYVVTGFYTSRIGLQSLDYPGLTFYGVSPGCTHHDNPEHVGL